MEIEGKILKIGETQTFGSNGFRKRELVVTVEEQYPQHILVEFVQDKVELLNSLNVGDLVKVSINLRGREWISPEGDKKYFNSVQGWRISEVSSDSSSKSDTTKKETVNTMAYSPSDDADSDDLPF